MVVAMLDSKAFRATDDHPYDTDYDHLSPQNRLQTLQRQARHDTTRERVSRDYSVDPPPDRSSPVQRLAARWIPESLLHARVDPGRAGMIAVVAVVVVVLLAVGISALTGGSSTEAAAPLPPPVADPPAIAPAAAAPPAPTKLVVSVVGQVERPGLVTVPDGARVADALVAAGGALPGTDLTTLNLARRLADGEQLYVAIPVPPQVQAQQPPGAGTGGGPAAGGGDGKIDLNSATVEQLDGVPGIGTVTAQRIVQWRDQHGRFTSVDQLGEVGGIGEVRLARLRDLVRV